MAENSTGSEHLVIQTAFLGDLLLGIPLYKHLKTLKPQDKLTLLCRRGLGEFMVRSGLVDEAIEVDKKNPASWREAVDRLKRRRFGWLICPHESPRSTWLARSLSAELKVGYRHFLSVFAFDERVSRPMALPEALRQLALLEPVDRGWADRLGEFASGQSAAGGQDAGGSLLEVPAWATMSVPLFEKIRSEYRLDGSLKLLDPHAREIASDLATGRPLAFLAPGSVWPTKMWTRTGFSEVARVLAEMNYQVVLLGSADEREICEEIARAVPGASVVAGRTTLFESVQLLALASLFIGNDSGAMHMAAVAGVPTVAVFGPTVVEFGYRPWQSRARVVQMPRAELQCRPCGKHGAKSCPIGTHECMTRVEPSRVVDAAMELMSRT